MNSAGGGGGRDRDKGRKYQSGSGKRKAKEERAAREKKVLSKMPKISEMFSTKTSNSAVLETVDIVGGTHLADNLNPEIFKELEQNTHYVDTTAEVAAECKSVCDDDHIDTTNLNSPSYLPDLGLWPTLVSENMREYWIAKGSSECQNLDADFSATSTRFEGEEYNRQCQKSLFTFAHSCTKQQYPRNWLCFSHKSHKGP